MVIVSGGLSGRRWEKLSKRACLGGGTICSEYGRREFSVCLGSQLISPSQAAGKPPLSTKLNLITIIAYNNTNQPRMPQKFITPPSFDVFNRYLANFVKKWHFDDRVNLMNMLTMGEFQNLRYYFKNFLWTFSTWTFWSLKDVKYPRSIFYSVFKLLKINLA